MKIKVSRYQLREIPTELHNLNRFIEICVTMKVPYENILIFIPKLMFITLSSNIREADY